MRARWCARVRGNNGNGRHCPPEGKPPGLATWGRARAQGDSRTRHQRPGEGAYASSDSPPRWKRFVLLSTVENTGILIRQTTPGPAALGGRPAPPAQRADARSSLKPRRPAADSAATPAPRQPPRPGHGRLQRDKKGAGWKSNGWLRHEDHVVDQVLRLDSSHSRVTEGPKSRQLELRNCEYHPLGVPFAIYPQIWAKS